MLGVVGIPDVVDNTGEIGAFDPRGLIGAQRFVVLLLVIELVPGVVALGIVVGSRGLCRQNCKEQLEREGSNPTKI
jgi:hypothetical protein